MMNRDRYHNRREAGKILAGELEDYSDRHDVLVLALPRGGVPVAFEIAMALHVPLDVFIVRKLGVPGHTELAMGALATGEVTVFNEDIIGQLNISQDEIETVIDKESAELKRREMVYRDNKPLPTIKGKTIILVDDGIATGATMRAAIKSLRILEPTSIIVAVPVADYDMCEKLKPLVDKLICPLRPTNFYAVGVWYEDFSQTEDDEVYTLLKEASKYSLST